MNEKECRAALAERSAGRCERCGKYGPTTLHHRIKRSHLPKSRYWELSNVLALCGNGTMKCHGAVEANPNDSHERGYHCRPWESPEDRPVLIHGLYWVKLSSGKPEYTSLDEGER